MVTKSSSGGEIVLKTICREFAISNNFRMSNEAKLGPFSLKPCKLSFGARSANVVVTYSRNKVRRRA